MKVRISYTVEVSDKFRRAINNHYGKPGMATREDVQQWYATYGDSADDDIMADLERDEEKSESP